MAIDTSSLMLSLNGLLGNNNSYNSYNNILTGGMSSGNSFQNILLSALLNGNSASGQCPYCAAMYGGSGSTAYSSIKTSGNAHATGQELNQYFEEAEEKYGVSADLLRAVAKVESDYNINAEGVSGAKGLMQLMPAMAKEMGIENIYDPRENIMGAARSLARKLEFNGGNVEQAVRSYHAANVAAASYKGKDVELSLDDYVKQVLKYAEEDLKAEVSVSQKSKAAESAASSTDSEGIFSAKDVKYLAEMSKLQMQMQTLSAFNTTMNTGSSGGLI